MIKHNEISLEQTVNAVCTERVDAGVSDWRNVFHLYIPSPKGFVDRTFCGILLETITMIDQGEQGMIKDAKVSCQRCDKTLQKILLTNTIDGDLQ